MYFTTYLLLVLFAMYALVILSFLYGWGKIKVYKPTIKKEGLKLSIVVACRNEQDNISNLLTCLVNQNYTSDLYEIIIVNDHSTDKTVQLINNFTSRYKNVFLYHLPEHLSGKKHALSFGVNKSVSEIIVSTDADCLIGENWINTLANYYLEYTPKLLSAPVVLFGKKLFEKLQALEFMSLIGSGAGAIGISHPIMCNGANLLFEKSLFKASDLNNKMPSGDDIFLMLSAKMQDSNSVQFVKSTDAIVRSYAEPSFKRFIHQRARWVSKSKAYRDFDIIFTAAIVGLVNMALILLLCVGVLGRNYELMIYAFVIKFIVDFLLLFTVSRFFKLEKLLVWMLPLQLIYPFYVSASAIWGLLGNFNWKSRKFR